MSESHPATMLEGRTAWGRNVETPLRDFLKTETGSAAVLLAATLAALAWVNIDAGFVRAPSGTPRSPSAWAPSGSPRICATGSTAA